MTSASTAPESPGVDEATIEALTREWPALEPRLRLIARRAGATAAQAADVAQETYLAILEGRRRWRRATHATFASFAQWVARSVASHMRGRGAGKFETPATEDAAYDGAPASTNPEELAAMREEAARYEAQWSELVESFREDDACRGLLALASEGVYELTLVMDRLGLTRDEVRAARARITYAIERAAGPRPSGRKGRS
jgi:DNA-directed RNA polymerase specialized sigma24 family protein